MPDPIEIARAAWPGEWSHTQKDVYVMMLPTPPSSLDWSEIRSTVRVFPADNWWFVSVDVGDMELFDDEGPDLADLLTRARAASVDALVPLLRALGADLITAALADTDEDPSAGYGAFPGGDPRTFTPDTEVCTPEEIQAHADACRLADEREARGEPVALPGSHVWEAKDGALIHVAHEPFGIGVYQIGGADLDTDGEE